MKKIIFTIVGTAIVLVGYQNCSQKEFNTASEKIVSQQNEGDTETVTPISVPTDPTSVNVVDVETYGPVVRAYGTCNDGSSVNLDGDVSLNFGSSDKQSCNNQEFDICNKVKNYFGSNAIDINTLNNSSGSITSTETVSVNVRTDRLIIFTVDTFIKRGLMLDVSGTCSPGATIKFNIYNQEKKNNQTVCTANGTFSTTNLPLLNVSPRILVITHYDVTGIKTEVRANVDGEQEAVSCQMTNTIKHEASICSDKLGKVTGTCSGNYPVLLTVKGVVQGYAVCKNGAFSIDSVLLAPGTATSDVRITQRNAYGKSCSDTEYLQFMGL